ncbi:MAG: hypothetical protein R3321_11035 [Nitrososphaeraceae archaeon]|nr:hypothetical protein [Nitrososphaeraceae archaeon]
MKFSIIMASIFVVFFSTIMINSAYSQPISVNEINFLQTGQFNADTNQFQISNDMNIREFSNGNIVRISGQTIEGFPYITYSKMMNDKIDTQGIIFINGKFMELDFSDIPIQEEIDVKKTDDLSILVQYTQRVYDKQFIKIDMKVFDKNQNKLNDYYQNYAYVPNADVSVSITNEENQEVYSSEGITNERGFYNTQFLVPDRSKIETLIVTINAEDKNSKSSKLLQIFTLGAQPKGDSSS